MVHRGEDVQKEPVMRNVGFGTEDGVMLHTYKGKSKERSLM